MNRKYSGFTLVEMLIVMGIIIILMVVGITAGRFAINRANDVAHKSAVDNVYTSLQAYYTDNREYPTGGTVEDACSTGGCTIANLVSGPSYLVPYIDQDSFDGGADATYWYGVGGDGQNQAVLVCVSLRGDGDENGDKDDGEIYCNGNGWGETLLGLPAVVLTDTIKNGVAGEGLILDAWTSESGSTWSNSDKAFETIP